MGDQITLNGSTQKYRVVGFAKDAKLNIASVVYGSLSIWQTLKGTGDQFAASGIFSDQKQTVKNKNLKQYSTGTFIDKLPGYAAQNMTFEFMIAFLMVISLIVITVFFIYSDDAKDSQLCSPKSTRNPSSLSDRGND